MESGIAESKVVIFSVGREEYAVAIQYVKEVVTWTQPIPVPDAPPMVEGVVDLRGDVIAVVDLGRRFGMGRAKEASQSRIMVIEINGRQAGFVVDDVTEVFTAPPGSVTLPSPLLRKRHGDPVVAGILKAGGNRLVVVVDAAKILAEGLLD